MSKPQPGHVGSVLPELRPLRKTTLDPEVRSLYQVKIEHAGEADTIFQTV